MAKPAFRNQRAAWEINSVELVILSFSQMRATKFDRLRAQMQLRRKG
jgi:hypothetical protein